MAYRSSVTELAEDAFARLVERSIDAIPAPFAERLGSVAIVIEAEPTPGQLGRAGAVGLFGLYEGVPRTAYGADHATIPSKITLFRGPLLRGAPTLAGTRGARSTTASVLSVVNSKVGSP